MSIKNRMIIVSILYDLSMQIALKMLGMQVYSFKISFITGVTEVNYHLYKLKISN